VFQLPFENVFIIIKKESLDPAFLFESRSHPELVDLSKKRELLIKASGSLSNSLRGKIAEVVRLFGTHFDEVNAFDRSESIEENSDELTSPLSIISAVRAVVEDISGLLDDRKKQDSRYVHEDRTTDLIVRHTALLGRLIPIRPDNEKGTKTSPPWNAKEATRRLQFILDHFTEALDVELFSEENARALYKEKTI
jgi:hypothetical protein